MKRLLLPLSMSMAAVLMVLPFTSTLSADPSVNGQAEGVENMGNEYPIGKDCIITLDPQHNAPEIVDQAVSTDRGFLAPYTVRGTLDREQQHWLILKEGRFENWVPKSKILLIRVSE